MTVFDIVNLISKEKRDISDKFDNDPEFRKQYNQFMINRILGSSNDLIYLAEVADKLHVDNKTHYLFWHNIINKKFRYIKYAKKDNENYDDLKLVSGYYNVTYEQANDILGLLDKEQIKNIRETYKHGKG